MRKIAVIDIGTVSVRLAIAEVQDGWVESLAKASNICNLGEGVSESGRLTHGAINRVMNCVDEYLSISREQGAEAVCCTLTSAARDASNAVSLLSELSMRGLMPQVIPGETEGALTFLGVASDFAGERIVVADNGGGSTELAVGSLDERGMDLKLDWVKSYDVGCRRVTERFLSQNDPPSEMDMLRAHDFCRLELSGAALKVGVGMGLTAEPTRLIVCGGTATSCVAMVKNMLIYESEQVHLSQLTRGQIAKLEEGLASVTLAKRRRVVGLQEQRAPVILGGIVCIAELMDVLHFDRISVSEHDLLFGLSRVAGTVLEGGVSPIGWTPELYFWN